MYVGSRERVVDGVVWMRSIFNCALRTLEVDFRIRPLQAAFPHRPVGGCRRYRAYRPSQPRACRLLAASRPRGPRTLMKFNDIVRSIILPARAVTFIVSIPDHEYEPLIVTVSVFVFEAVQLPLKETR